MLLVYPYQDCLPLLKFITFKQNKTMSTPIHTHASVEQLQHNSTSWLGHRKGDHKDIITGQTFIAPTEGDLNAIEVFSSVVTNPGEVVMTLYAFDPKTENWGSALGESHVLFNRTLNDKWVAFKIPGLHLSKGMSYGFKLESRDSYVGLGETVGSARFPAFASGKEWKFSSANSKSDAHSYSYFSLAFKVDLKAA